MIEYIFEIWFFVWIKSNYQLILSCIIGIVFMVFIGQKILGKDTFDDNKKLDIQEKIKVYFALFCGVITSGLITVLTVSYFN